MFLNKAVAFICSLIVITVLHGCDDKKGVGVCPIKDVNFFSDSLKKHYLDQNQPANAGAFKLVGDALYDDQNNWWMVPFDLDGQKLQALLSCDGRLEITGR
ncbi:hypothetical protein [Pseudomonas yamanorum]|uniref:hypothetical protein n=1 Tax=Pseudomonas yamanorum TaxID=515393 RepID=UPI003B9E6FA4